MRCFWFLAITLLSMLQPVAAQSSAPQNQGSRALEIIPVQRRMALIIGNSNYPVGKLKNPVNDAIAMELALKKLGFGVTTLRDANFRQMRQSVNIFASTLRKGDLAFFYYSGHGLQIKERNYLVPIDFTGESATDAEYETLAADQVRQRLEETQASVRLLVLDACRQNPFPTDSRGSSPGLREMDRAEGTLVAFATGANNIADDNPSEANGLYTKYLIAALQTPGLNHVEVFKRVQAEVKRNSPGGKQNPAYYDNIIGLVVLNTTGGTVNLSVKSKTDSLVARNELNEEEVYWRECQAQKEAFCDAYLAQFPQGRFAKLAELYRKPSEAPLKPGEVKIGPDGLDYIWIPAGRYQMGCSPGDSQCHDNEPSRDVEIPKGFWLGKTEVTQEAYERITGSNPSTFKGPSLPVESVNWFKAREFCARGRSRLPTEEEWEYAARAGSTEARYGFIDRIAWYGANSARSTHKVGQKDANAWGLKDMMGNVLEWTESSYDSDNKVLRGGAWYNVPQGVRASLRFSDNPASEAMAFGFRCLRDSL